MEKNKVRVDKKLGIQAAKRPIIPKMTADKTVRMRKIKKFLTGSQLLIRRFNIMKAIKKYITKQKRPWTKKALANTKKRVGSKCSRIKWKVPKIVNNIKPNTRKNLELVKTIKNLWSTGDKGEEFFIIKKEWSRWRELNPRQQIGSLIFYH